MIAIRLAVLTASTVTLARALSAHAEVRIGLAAPLTDPNAWGGAWTRGAVEAAVADINTRGGLFGDLIETIVADDYCDADQAVAAANKLVADGVAVVFGHQCSGAAIPASEVYAQAGIPMISTGATNPNLTERGLSNVTEALFEAVEPGKSEYLDVVQRMQSGRVEVLIHAGRPG